MPTTVIDDLPLRYKAASRSDAKKRIARRATEMLWPGCTLALNGGTTTIEIARAIPAVSALSSSVTVVTNASGGVARRQSYELVGRTDVVADSAKLGAVGFAQICRLTEVAGVLTDDDAEPAAVQSLADSGIEVLGPSGFSLNFPRSDPLSSQRIHVDRVTVAAYV